MKRMYFLGVFLMFAAFLGSGYTRAQKMPQEADKVYKELSKAIVDRNIQALEGVMSKAGFTEVRNQALSIGIPFPEGVFDMLNASLLDFSKFTFIKYSKKGPTVNAYYTYTQEGTVTSIITLKLLEEENQLKLVALVNHDARDYVINLYQKDYSFLDAPEFQPSGVVPVAAVPVEHIDYLAVFDLFCYGYTVTLTVNNRLQAENIKNELSGTVIGGINKGDNVVQLELHKFDPGEKEKPFIAIRAFINGEEKEVFFLNEEIEGKLERTFRVE